MLVFIVVWWLFDAHDSDPVSIFFSITRLGDTRALASRQEDNQWSSFVYWTVACTIYAEERQISQASSNHMPVVKLFGENHARMLRDAIAAVGNYGEIYTRNLEKHIPRRGLNKLNADQIGQQLRAIAFT